MKVPKSRKKRQKAWEKYHSVFILLMIIWWVFKCLGLKGLLYWSDYKVLTEPECNCSGQGSFSDIPDS